MTQIEEFAALGLSERMLEAVKAKGFETPSPIQKLTLPVILNEDCDIIAQAQTGTGKTAAFGLPLLERLQRAKGAPQALVLVPTRELALQVTEELLSFNRETRLSIASIYGGASMSEQLRRLSRGIDIVVGTPGRILDHMRRGTLDLSQITYLVLDEADEMLNMGFIEDIEQILSGANPERRVLLFSATMPERIVALSQNYMRDTRVLRVEAQQLTADLTDQIYFEVRESDKFDALTRIIDVEPDFYGIVFCRTKVGVDELTNRLLERGYSAEGLHGDVSQSQREQVLRKFKKKQANILVATDVAARGIDIDCLTHVINYSLPQDTESYVHRIGRTGRAGHQGTAITFISSSEFRQFGFLRRSVKVEIKKETLPTPQDIVAIKRQKIKDDLAEVVETGNYTDYEEMASEILSSYDPQTALGALLRLAFRNELDESRYPEIRSINVDRRGTARLFLSVGRLDGYDPRRMVELLKRECGLSDSKINDVKVADAYSFVTVPYAEAEGVVRRLNTIKKDGRPIAEIAKERGSGKSSRRRKEGGGDGPARREYGTEREPRAKRSGREPGEGREEKRGGKPSREPRGEKPRRTPSVPRKSELRRTEAAAALPGRDGNTQQFNEGFDWSFFERGGNSWGKGRGSSKGRRK